MKTSEFNKRVEQLGYRTCKNAAWLDVIAFNHHIPEVQVNTAIDAIRVNTTNKELIKFCIAYAETPIEEREEEKKYRVIIPDPEREVSRESLARIVLARTVNGKIVINVAKKSNIETLKRYRLTESEIKRNHEYLWQFAKEVEG